MERLVTGSVLLTALVAVIAALSMFPGTSDLGPEAYLHVQEVEETGENFERVTTFENLSSSQQNKFKDALEAEDKTVFIDLGNFSAPTENAVIYHNSTYVILVSEEDFTIDDRRNISKSGPIADSTPLKNRK